jgi:hypothetical protein
MSRFGLRTFRDGQVDLLMKRSPSTGQYRVRFYDIDGTVLKEQFVNEGNDASPPETPNIDPTYLVFAEWNQDFTNVDRDIEVGAMYDTIDGKTYIFIRLTDTIGLQPTLDLNKTTGDTLTVDWGDSTTDTTSTNGNQTVQKTAAYAAIGDYVISIDCAGEYRNRAASSIFVDTQPYRSSVLKIYMGSTMTVQNNCFQIFVSMSIISLNKSIVFAAQVNIFNGSRSLSHCNISKNSTGLSTSFFLNCVNLKSVSFPPTVTTLGANCFQSCSSLTYIDLKNITSFTNSSFRQLGIRQDIVIPSTITDTGTNTFNSSPQITSITVAGSGLTTIGSAAFVGIFSVTSLEFPSSVTSIGTFSFNENTQILEYTFNSTTPPTLANINAFTGINSACKIYVPDASVATYKAATNWVTYVNYIYPLSTKP